MAKRRSRGRGGSMRTLVRKRAATHSKGQNVVQLPEGMESFKPKKKENLISIIPYTVSIENHPEGPLVGGMWYEKTYGVHFNVGPQDKALACPRITNGDPCPICEEHTRLRKDPEVDEDILKALRPKERQIYNVVTASDPGTVLIFEMAYYLFGKVLEEAIQEGAESLGAFADIEGGSIIKVYFRQKKYSGNAYLEAVTFEFRERGTISDDVLDQALDLDTLIQVLSYDDIKKEFDDGQDSGDDDDAAEDTSQPTRGRKKTAPEPEEPDFSEGDKIIASLSDGDYLGEITSIDGDDATIKFEDGDILEVPISDLELETPDDPEPEPEPEPEDDSLSVGDRVIAVIEDADYPGQIDSIENDKATITFDDGDVIEVPMDDVRPEDDDPQPDEPEDQPDDTQGSGDDFGDWNFEDKPTPMSKRGRHN